ncbi:hypothetical protein EB001_22700 [bacterium]|nr:hypothetical protein [bacterium]
MENFVTRKLYSAMIQNNFNEGDLFVTVRLFGVVDKEKFITDMMNKIRRIVYPNRSYRKNNPNCIKCFAVIGWVNEKNEKHSAAHILIQNVFFRSTKYSSFEDLVDGVFRKNRTLPGDVDVKKVWDVVGATDYALFDQGYDVTVVNDTMSLVIDNVVSKNIETTIEGYKKEAVI